MKQEAQKGIQSPSSASTHVQPSILLYMDKAMILLILSLFFLPPLFLIPQVTTYDTVTHVKYLLVNFTLSTLAVLCIVRLVFFHPNNTVHKDPVRILVLLFAITMLVSCLLSHEVMYCLHQALFMWGFHLMFLIMPEILQSETSRNRCRLAGDIDYLAKIRLVILFTGFLVAGYGLCQYFGGDFIFRWFRYDIKDKIARNYIISTIGNPEYLGSYLAPLVLLCLPELLENKRKGILILVLLASMIFISALLLTGTRGAIFALACGSIPILIFTYREALPRRRIRMLGTMGILFIFIIIFVIIFSFPNPLNRHNQAILQRFKNLANLQSTSMKERILFYSIGSEIIARSPLFGVGEGMFRVEFYPAIKRLSEKDDKAGVSRFLVELKNRVADNAHNDFLQIWIENGTMGFMIFTLAVTFLIAQACSVAFLKTIPSRDRRLLVSFTGAALCLLVNATFSFPMHTPARSILFWGLLGATHSGALTLIVKEAK
jgi:O-antigen ligase